MSDAPERIWADSKLIYPASQGRPGAVEYIRADIAEAKLHDEERFLRAYPDAVKKWRWEEVARLLSGKCRDLERKAAAANAQRDIAEAEAATLRAQLAEAREATALALASMARAQWALQPFSNCVFNDNGDCTVTASERVNSYDCLKDAHFAYKDIRATLARIAEDTP